MIRGCRRSLYNLCICMIRLCCDACLLDAVEATKAFGSVGKQCNAAAVTHFILEKMKQWRLSGAVGFVSAKCYLTIL
jgi:hypothetical protein